MHRYVVAWVVGVVLVAGGCGDAPPASRPQAAAKAGTAPPAIPTASPQPAATGAEGAAKKGAAAPAPGHSSAVPPASKETTPPQQPVASGASSSGAPASGEAAPAGERKTLDDFGRKKLDGDPIVSPITVPVEVYLGVKWRVVALTVQNALNTQKGISPDGKGPRTHEEFMSEVIEKNGISLPDLPAGHKYVYDPQSEQLLVEKPTK